MKMYVLWALSFAAAEAALSFVQFLFRTRTVKKAVRVSCTAAKALTAIACAALVMAGPVILRPVQPLMVIVYAVLLPDAAAAVLYGMYCAVRRRTRRFAAGKALSLVLGILFFVYGTVNMQVVRPTYRTFSSPKLTQEHTIVFAADLHVGSAQSFSTLEKTIASIRSEQPDAVILGGDITDDYTTKEEMEQTYRLFGSQIDAPVYYVFGNHEVVQHEKYMPHGLHYTEQELIQAIRSGGVTILEDAYTELAPDLLLLGRADAASDRRLGIDALRNPAPEKYLLVADHQPTCAKENLAAGTDLQLSAHTHAGQLFPNGLFFSLFSFTNGEYAIGDGCTLLVSPGACGWRVPFRTESHCRYEVITLRPED